MAFRFCFSVALLMSVWARTKCDHIPEGSVLMECRDRYFMIAVDGSCIGNEPHFEAVDGTGVYPITRQYAAKCGYAVDVVALLGHLELRASYFSCHTGNTDDKVFTFNFNLILMYEGKEVHYALNKTCSPSLPWSPREITCEVDYMEVSVRTDVVCPSTTNRDWDAALQTVHASAASDWQVVFQTVGQKLMPMNLSEAHRRGYVFDLTEGRLVFRTPYRQPDSFITVMNDVPVEMVHATLFSRQRWVVLMVDMVAACSMHEGSFNERRYMVWKAPEFVHPLVLNLHSTKINAGVNGELVEEGVAEERGYTVETTDNTIQIIIPYTAEGWYRKSFVVGDLFEFYVFNLYLEQIAVDEDQVETRLRYYRTLTSPLVLCSVFTIRRTDLEERMFSVYLGGVPRDVELVAVSFNGHTFTLPLTSTSISMSPSIHPNTTHGYTLKVAFDDPVVLHEFHKDSVMMHKLDVYFILATVPENECFYHVTSLIALTNVSPPVFDAFCSDSGISFTLDHQPFNYLWEFSIGSDPLTSDLAARHGYVMSNDSQSLQLHVPLFTPGYKYKNVTLKGFLGIFKILVQDKETLEIQASTVKMCPFNTTTELIVCSTDGRMDVVADLSLGDPSPGIPTRTSLRNKRCRPKEADDTRVLFSFPLHTCGSIIKLGKHSVTYENKIFFSKNLHAPTSSSGSDTDSVTVQCSYALRGLQRLFSLHRFESDADGVGCIVHSAHANEAPPVFRKCYEVNVTKSAQSPVEKKWRKSSGKGHKLFKRWDVKLTPCEDEEKDEGACLSPTHPTPTEAQYLTGRFQEAFRQWLQVWALVKMLPSQVRLLLALFFWALLGQVSAAPHTDLRPQALGADEARNKDLANLLLDSFVSELVAARGDRMLPDLEEKEEVMRRHLSFSQRERKAGCRNFFWKTFTAC